MGNTKSSFVVRKLSVKENVYSRSLITELSALEKKKNGDITWAFTSLLQVCFNGGIVVKSGR